jgi:protein TonB
MAGYRQSRPDKAKAAAAALLVHVVIGAAFLTGLVTKVSRKPSEIMKTIDINEPPPPPVVEEVRSAPKGEAGDAGKKADPTPVVAPEPEIEVPAKPPIAAAPLAGQGAAPSAGAALAGSGTGAGGSGTGQGGGGTGGTGFTPARKVTKIPDREYRRIRALSGMARGSVGLSIRVGADGTPSNCRIARTSGDAAVDALMCELTLTWVRFRPARDPQGRAVEQDVTWFPDWSPR